MITRAGNYIMAFDKLFCPIKTSKSSRKSTTSQHQQTNTRQEPLHSTNGVESQHRVHHETPTSNSSNISWRYVTEAYHARDVDEISVEQGDLVAYVRTCDEWSYVILHKKGGYVPSYVLKEHSIKPKVRTASDTRASIDLHQHSRPHSHKTHCTSERTCHSNGCSVKPVTSHPFDVIANSAHGSSGCQTFPTHYPDLPMAQMGTFSPYYNDCMASLPVCNNFQPFHFNTNCEAFFVSHIFVAREENDLEVRPSEEVVVLNRDDPDWYWVRRTDGKEGFVPAKFMVSAREVSSAILHKGNSTATMKSSNHNDFHTYANQPAERRSLATDQQSTANL